MGHLEICTQIFQLEHPLEQMLRAGVHLNKHRSATIRKHKVN